MIGFSKEFTHDDGLSKWLVEVDTCEEHLGDLIHKKG